MKEIEGAIQELCKADSNTRPVEAKTVDFLIGFLQRYLKAGEDMKYRKCPEHKAYNDDCFCCKTVKGINGVIDECTLALAKREPAEINKEGK